MINRSESESDELLANSMTSMKTMNNSEGQIKASEIQKKKKFFSDVPTILLIILLIIGTSGFIVLMILYKKIDIVPTLLTNDDLERAQIDDKDYLMIRLYNGLNVTLISKPKAEFASVSVTINKGSNNDPLSSLGLSYLSNKFFITKSKNNLNFTKTLRRNFGKLYYISKEQSTTFYFDVERDGLQKTLKYFTPLLENIELNTSYSKDLSKSIETNYNNHRKNYRTLESQILYNFSTSKSDYFPQGNLETLFHDKNATRLMEDITNFLKENVITDNMNVVIYSRHKLHILRSFAIKYFSNIPNSTSVKKQENKAEYNLRLGNIIFTDLGKTKKGYLSLSFFFKKSEFPNIELYLKYFQYLVKGSSNKNYRFNIENSPDENEIIKEIYSSISTYKSEIVVFKISAELFEEQKEDSLKYYKNVLTRIVAIIEHIKSESITQHREIYNNFFDILRANFTFEPVDRRVGLFASQLSESAFNFSSNISAFTMRYNYLPKFEEENFRKILEHFSYNNSLILFSTSNPADISSKECSLKTEEYKEPFYNVSYKACQIKAEEMNEIIKNSKNPEYKIFKMRGKNEFFDSDIKVENARPKISDQMKMKNYSQNLQLYHKLDVDFNEPRIGGYFQVIHGNIRPGNDTDRVIGNLYYEKFVNILIKEELGDAIDAGNSINVFNEENGLIIRIFVYSNNFEKIVEKLNQIIYNKKGEEIEKYYSIIKTLIKIDLTIERNRSSREKWFNYYKIMMKKNAMNKYSDELYEKIDKGDFRSSVVINVPILMQSTYTIVCFMGDINYNKAQVIFNNTIFKSIDPDKEGKEPEKSILVGNWSEVLSSEKVIEYLNFQYSAVNYYIFKFNTTSEKDEYLVSNNFIFSSYNKEEEHKLFLIKSLMASIFENSITEKEDYHSSNLYTFNGVTYLNYLSSSHLHNNTKKNEEMDEIIKIFAERFEETPEKDSAFKKDLEFAIDERITEYYRNETSLEERARKIFNDIKQKNNHTENDLEIFEQYKRAPREYFRKFTKEKLKETFRQVFETQLQKVSIQLYPNNTHEGWEKPSAEEEVFYNLTYIKAKVYVNEFSQSKIFGD